MNSQQPLPRRQFLGNAVAAGAAVALAGAAAAESPQKPARKIKLGLIGCGGRGSWLGGLFVQHGGYEIAAVADYFPERAAAAGNKLMPFSESGGHTSCVPPLRTDWHVQEVISHGTASISASSSTICSRPPTTRARRS